MRNLFIICKSAILAPVVMLLWLVTSRNRKKLIKEDYDNWCRWKGLNYGFMSLIRLFAAFPEFRSLYYYRVGYVSHIISWLLKGQSSLFFRSKTISGGLLIQHGFATIIDAERIGNNCKIYQQVTVGFNGDKRPIIGNNVIICAGAKVLGGITVGNNVIIGANAVVVKDVPDNSVAGGVPAHIIKRLSKKLIITD